MSSRHHVDEATALEIIDHAAVAVDQYDRGAMTRFQVMEADPVDLDELTLRRVVPFGFTREVLVPYGGACKPCSGQDGPSGSKSALAARGCTQFPG